MYSPERLAYLLSKIETKTATEGDLAELLHILQEDQTGKVVEALEKAHAAGISSRPLPDFTTPYWKDGIREVLSAYRPDTTALPIETGPKRVPMFRRWTWAAAAVLLVTAGSYFLYTITKDKNVTVPGPAMAQQNILPGKDGAVLTLADGRQIVLDSVANGIVATQHGANAVLKDGSLSYSTGAGTKGEMVYNTLSTPKGRQFRMELPDGSKVWLNAASSIRFPTVFGESERKVEIRGEVYFEVIHQAARPFKVNVNNRANIEVLGTSFNVNSYENEETINTTLLEGSVKISLFAPASDNKGQALMLKPGQQARISQTGSAGTPAVSVVNDIDTDKIIAWKNGYFNFGKASLQEVMRQLERWYDIEVVYEKDIPDIHFVGKMTRNIKLSDLFQILESSGVNFKIEGKKIIVTK